MSFEPDPVLILETMEDVRQAMTQPKRALCGFTGLDLYHIKSVWLCSLIRQIAARKYPYNSVVKKEAEKLLELPEKSDAEYSCESDSLSTLIYNAQKYCRHDDLIAAGYTPFTAEMVEKAYEQGKQVEIRSESGLLGIGGSTVLLTVRKRDGYLYAMRPRKRKYHVNPSGQPARLVDPENLCGPR